MTQSSQQDTKVLVTGGAGYIGSHTCVELIRAGYGVVIYDNFSNSHREVIDRIARIAGAAPIVVDGDVRDRETMATALARHLCGAVIHFAGLKSITQSVSEPARYYDNNVVGTLRLVQAMEDAGVHRLVFSSSAAVYGDPVALPLTEDHRLSPRTPYGRTKLVVETMLADLAAASNRFEIAILRYFNPAGSHDSGLIGEDPRGAAGNLAPLVAQVAMGRRSHVTVFGDDYDTIDGTGVRDYVHVMDLAAGHICALRSLDRDRFLTVNLGTGRGTSVLELIDAFAQASGATIPVQVAPRRSGDVASNYASADLAERVLGWRARRNLADICRDAWNWQRRNPNGYAGPSEPVGGLEPRP
ncbi:MULTISPECIES: UDP-glucose 4-epimerase GalE [Rhodopseudomonas]|uniref:UDP-glucose 4-epimerase n=1 Tax=Rhodopseudomonas palustris TaxID=1076 RepID=A0A0D7E8A6_RHOPL|nr:MULTISPECIES: UDP-glucose 4-epimerase GalE [Rhodopseudomonas]KIZ35757.1 hypothetical protein OO17_25425 [Rhodopseudomonas palustris]MDF3810830.1 UDP-glucose 4-epimerase GalE [Rhodopseudomonas sp. BAL398]WOK20730.1 UDP-glucose 4-epimerase GalE [Rhodopseudomonas sp. BAL398]